MLFQSGHPSKLTNRQQRAPVPPVWHRRQRTDSVRSTTNSHISNPALRLREVAESPHYAHILNQGLQHTHNSERDWAGNDYCRRAEIMLKRKRAQKLHEFPNFCRRKIDPCMASVYQFAEGKGRISLLTG